MVRSTSGSWPAAAHSEAASPESDPLRADLVALSAADRMTRSVLAGYPGLRGLYAALSSSVLHLRPKAHLPRQEAAIEALIRNRLGDPYPLEGLAAEWQPSLTTGAAPAELRATQGYRPVRPVPLWLDLRGLERSERTSDETEAGAGTTEEGAGGNIKAKRRASDQAARQDSLILHKFEAILSWAEFLNLNRRVDDDDNEDAKKAAEDQDEIGLGQVDKAPATRLKLHLDLAPEDADREALSAKLTYPEWDCRAGAYLADHCCVLESWADPDPDAVPDLDPAAARRIRAVRRQFEALRPGRVIVPAQPDGEDLDLEAAVRAIVDLAARGEGSDRIWRQSRKEGRDLAVSILLDVSRSTDSAVGDRRVIDVEHEALTALAWGLDACGDDFAVSGFSSLRRDRVYLSRCKAFGDPMSDDVVARISGLKPGFYTRMGAAIRHVSQDLARQGRKRRLLLVITDGKPNDLDHYEGRHGIEDTAMAIREARRLGQAVFAVTVDGRSKPWFARMFGRGGFAVVARPDALTQTLPAIYRQLVGS